MIDNPEVFVTVGTLILSSVFALSKYIKYKRLFNNIVDVLVAIRDALDDDTVTKSEVRNIIGEAEDIINDLKFRR